MPQNKDRKYNIEYVLSSLPRAILAFLALVLHGGNWSFVHGEKYRYPVDRRVVGAQTGMKSEFSLKIDTPFNSLVTTILIELHLFIFNFWHTFSSSYTLLQLVLLMRALILSKLSANSVRVILVSLQLSTLNPRCYFYVGSTQYF